MSAMTALALVTISAPAAHAGRSDLDDDGIPNRLDLDVDGDGILNGDDRNVDGGVCQSGPLEGEYVGDRIANGSRREKDIDDDGRRDDSPREKDIDGDRIPDTDDDDIDGDGRDNGLDDDCDGDGRDREGDDDDDGDGKDDDDDVDDDNDGIDDDDDSGEMEIGLTGTEDAPAGSRVRAKIRKTLSGEIEFELDGKNLEEGSYDIVVNGTLLGQLVMEDDDGRTEGETDFETTPDDSDELPLPFDPAGLPVEIQQDGKVFFSGTVPTPVV